MPVGKMKNGLYALALPFVGRRCGWNTSGDTALDRVLKKHHVAGAAIQCFEKGKLTRCLTAGMASEEKTVDKTTVFRTASIAKMVTALLVFRLETLGRLNTEEDISDLLGFAVRNPEHPQTPITLGMVLSHTSSILDSPAYFASFQNPCTLSELLSQREAFLPDQPGSCFRYSNLAAGMIGCMLEERFGISLEELAQHELFEPLGVKATYDVSTLSTGSAANSWRVLPAALAFDAKKRIASAAPIHLPDPKHHYLLASGSLYLTAEALAKLTLAAWNGADGFIRQSCIQKMQTPLAGWPDQEVCMQHGMGLFRMDDSKICRERLWGHQGFAYGAVNGVFFNAEGTGFAALNSGSSEQRIGHLACINRDLIGLLMEEKQ